jgi:hypothetical protein
MAIRSGWYGVDHNNPEFVHFVNSTGHREFRQWISFDPPMPTGPVILVQAALSGHDIYRGTNARIAVHVDKISPNGFELLFTTWLDSVVYLVHAVWIAHTLD